MKIALHIEGIVQGIGFRPFVHRLATQLQLNGFVANTGGGAMIEIEGNEAAINQFRLRLLEELPSSGRINSMDDQMSSSTLKKGFYIQESSCDAITAPIPLDVALCNLCRSEMSDPANRRYGYAFTTCSECGPRYTILSKLPYDRANTSMRFFTMCSSCEAEYCDPTNRRYHAQSISCHDCGPILTNGTVAQAALVLREGKIIALKGIGGFHLMCDATNELSVKRLRNLKHRRSKPLAVMYPTLDAMKTDVILTDREERLLSSKEAPIIVVRKNADHHVAPSVASGIDRLGVMLPYSPLHFELFKQLDIPLVVTSANRSGEPIIFTRKQLEIVFGTDIDLIIDHNREIINPIDDSVAQCIGDEMMMLRMGRGFAPFSEFLAQPVNQKILAVGAHQKSAFAFAFGGRIVLSPHIGDLETLTVVDHFEERVQALQQMYDFNATKIVSDLHPEYASSQWAEAHEAEQIKVQHHYAHILACMAEHRLFTTTLGFAFDGSGYGEDESLWGGEVLIANINKYERISYLKPFALIGGKKAIKEPRRMALSLLFDSYTLAEILKMNNPTRAAFREEEICTLHRMWKQGINTHQTSSIGRLFDAVASLGGFVQQLGYEGESGLVMEGYVDATIDEPFSFTIDGGIIHISEMIKEIVCLTSVKSNPKNLKKVISSRFHQTIVAIILKISERYPHLPVVVAGGVFQNKVLMEKLQRGLQGREFYFQHHTPINDGGIALGQLWHAIHQKF